MFEAIEALFEEGGCGGGASIVQSIRFSMLRYLRAVLYLKLENFCFLGLGSEAFWGMD